MAQCESGGNWNINTGNGYYGGLQFSQSSWNAAGGSGNPANASKAEQIRVAENLLAMQGPSAWPNCFVGGSGGSASTAGGTTSVQSNQTTPVQQPQQAPVQQPAPQPAPAPAPAPEPAPAPQPAPAPAPEPAPAPAPAPAVSGETYTIQQGDTLSKIAQKLGIEGGWQALYQANADSLIDPNLIFTGEVLQLPA